MRTAEMGEIMPFHQGEINTLVWGVQPASQVQKHPSASLGSAGARYPDFHQLQESSSGFSPLRPQRLLQDIFNGEAHREGGVFRGQY